MKYKVVQSRGTSISGAITKLESEVNRLIQEGYSLQGGVAISENESVWITACQAMVKE